MELGRRGRVVVGAVTFALAARALYVGLAGDDEDPTPTDEDPMAADALAEAPARPVAERLGCTEIGEMSIEAPPASPEAGSVEAPFDCWIGGEFLARVYIAENEGEINTRGSYFADMRYGTPSGLNGIDACPNALDPIVIEGEGWLALTGSPEAADLVAERADGTVRQTRNHGPIVSYSPVLPPCDL